MKHITTLLSFPTAIATFLLFISLFPRLKIRTKYFVGVISLLTTIVTLIISFIIFFSKDEKNFLFKLDPLSKFITLWITIFGFIIVLYSIVGIDFKDENNITRYFAYVMYTIGSAVGAVVANNFVVFLTFWGMTGLLLYIMINQAENKKASLAAKKTLIIIGGSDVLMILGFGILWYFTQSYDMDSFIVDLNLVTHKWYYFAFIFLLLGSLAKAGAVPLHTWIPDMAEVVPVSMTAFLPASLDKLLGIYFLTRLCVNMFILNFQLSNLLMLIGAMTIITAVFMAMLQHEFKKLLAYHTVSQVGYMVLGIATATPIGVAGGLFHMLNNAIYKSCLLLTSGNVEQKVNTSDLDEIGGMGKIMPISFVGFLIAMLSISGVPPFNGFVSKWMVYQALIKKFTQHNSLLAIICLILAMFASALTLASFIKLVHAMFLGQATPKIRIQYRKHQEVHWTQIVPILLLSILCIVFGIFAFELPLRYFIFPVVSASLSTLSVDLMGVWQPQVVTFLILVGIIVGLVIYLLLNIKFRTTGVYLLGELKPDESRVSGTEFYNSIKELSVFKLIYFLAEKKFFDIYHLGKNIVLGIGSIISFFHTGNLHFYLSWVIVGLVLLLLVLLW